MSDKLILTDVDMVLLDWVGSFITYLREEKQINIAMEDLYRHAHLTGLLNITQEESSKLVADYTHSEHYKNIPIMNNNAERIKELAEDGWRFVAITAALNPFIPDAKIVRQAREDNLTRLFGDIFADIHLTCLVTGCKSEYLTRYQPTIWVDDSVNFALKGHEAGHHAHVMHSPFYHHQASDHGLNVIKSWDEIIDPIKKKQPS